MSPATGFGGSGLADIDPDARVVHEPMALCSLPSDVRVRYAVAGNGVVMFVDVEGGLWAFGGAASHKLGLGNIDGVEVPTKVRWTMCLAEHWH